MSQPVVIPWLPAVGNEAVIASLQTLGDAGSLVINSNNPALPQGPYVYDRVIRKVSLTSANNLSAARFTIVGIGSPIDAAGNPTKVLSLITEAAIVGPNADTIYSANIYSQIISIAVDRAVNAVSAGFGDEGITDYVFLDYNRTMFQASVQLQFLDRATITGSVYQTLNKPETPNINYGNMDVFNPVNSTPPPPLPAFAVSADLTAADTDQIGTTLSPVSMVWANFATTTNDSAIFTVLQQGLRS